MKRLMAVTLGSQPSWYQMPPVNYVVINIFSHLYSYRCLTDILWHMGLSSVTLSSAPFTTQSMMCHLFTLTPLSFYFNQLYK